jgi:galactitol-specific phosphotransferase system IIB component
MARHFIFKGGTSLSKAWKLIQRFSEDIDIALATDAFDRTYITRPSKTYVKLLKKEGCAYTSTVIKDALQSALRTMGVPPEMITIEADRVKPHMPDKDPQTLFVRYQSLYDATAYITSEIRVEFSVRSLKEPFATVPIRSILSEKLQDSGYTEDAFVVTVAEPHKTFLEKVFLLHEKFQLVENAEMIGDRQSRHFSDLVSMMDTEVETTIWTDPVFYNRLLDHRRNYIGLRGVDYQKMQMPDLHFVPPDNMVDQFRNDYNDMLDVMIYDEEAPDFDVLMDQLQLLNGRFILSGDKLKLDELIRSALEHIKEFDLMQDQPTIQTSITHSSGQRYLLYCNLRNDTLFFNRIIPMV